MHVLILGTTMSGKTTLAKKLVRASCLQNRRAIVYDPIHDPAWLQIGASFVTDDPQKFMEVVSQNTNCDVIVDEAGDFCTSYDRDSHWLATRARHLGHKSYFIGQRPTMIGKNIRDNCSTLFCFRVSKYDAKELANDFVCDDLLQAPELPKGQCVYLRRYEDAKIIDVFT